MVTKLKIPSAAKAKKYFQDKMAFTTGPVELERMVQQGQPVHIVDVRAAEDYAEGHIPGALYVSTSSFSMVATGIIETKQVSIPLKDVNRFSPCVFKFSSSRILDTCDGRLSDIY